MPAPSFHFPPGLRAYVVNAAQKNRGHAGNPARPLAEEEVIPSLPSHFNQKKATPPAPPRTGRAITTDAPSRSRSATDPPAPTAPTRSPSPATSPPPRSPQCHQSTIRSHKSGATCTSGCALECQLLKSPTIDTCRAPEIRNRNVCGIKVFMDCSNSFSHRQHDTRRP